ncbi:hypothetical protein [Paenibacillus camelliae]|uniref:hypothetical protein n=1 Tax=Paenibacillus camelliae TaxID=512410 RepID=UPI00203A518E|nr:hypothetical protein [Paenibacillus camelliae]MCM3635579.1 hypothetical protein [Paenibacillus camelliae]
MEFVNELKIKVEELVHFELNQGVSPIELAASIYDEDYTEIKIKKLFECIQCTVQFIDREFFSEKKVKHEYRYIYDRNNYLQEIHHDINKGSSLLWSRAIEREKLLNDIARIASQTDKVQLANFSIEKLSKEARDYLKSVM